MGPRLVRPHGTARALRAAGLPGGPLLVRLLAVAELGVGAGAAGWGGRAFDAAMAVSYALFGAFVAVALHRRWALSSCGCFGETDVPPTATHLVVDAVLAVAAAAGAATGSIRPLSGFGHHPAQATALTLVAVVTAGLVVLALTRLPTVVAATRPS